MSLSSDSSSRPSPFSVQEFSELVESAFNLADADNASPLRQPLLSFTPASPYSPSSLRSHAHSFDGQTDADSVSPLSSPPARKSRSRTITALRMFHQVRTRASAFVLRSRALSPSPTRSSSPSPAHFQLPSISPTPSASSFARALSPWSMVDLARDRPRSRAESLPRSLFAGHMRDSTPLPLPGSHSRSGSTSETRSTTPVLRSFFDDSPARSKRAYSRPATSTSTIHPLSLSRTTTGPHSPLVAEYLPSFFDDSGYQVAKPPVPSYSRPSTPSGTALHIHTRIPALRRSRSNGHGLKGRGHRRDTSTSDNGPHVGLGYQDLMLWNDRRDNGMPSPLTKPRDAPPIPDGIGDVDLPLPPPYVFERRGSAASTSTSLSTGSTRSTSSLSSRLSNLVGLAFPSKIRGRGRSKLNLSISTGPDVPSADSSPSTLSSDSPPSTPNSPTVAYCRAQTRLYAQSADGHYRGARSGDGSDEDVLTIGRVLTPEVDPFAKAEIAVPFQSTPRPPNPHRNYSQNTPPGLNRNATWDTNQPKPRIAQKIRISLPASPVSTAYTFPSSCSVHAESSPGREQADISTIGKSCISTPPSAWSSFTPDRSLDDDRPCSISTPTSQGSGGSLPSRLVFPLPPTNIPHPLLSSSLPPPDRALAPPVPPKDGASRVERVHKSLPPSPRPVPERRMIRTFSHMHEVSEAQVQEVPMCLGEPWSATVSDVLSEWPVRSSTPVTHRRGGSVDSTSTVTASPGSSALHEVAHHWGESPYGNYEHPAVVEGDSFYAEGASTTLSCTPPEKFEDGIGEFWTPVTSNSSSTVFYSARSSVDETPRSRFSLDSSEEGYPVSQFVEDQHARARVPILGAGKAASSGPCV